MDSIKINQISVDRLHPMLTDLLRSINKIPQILPNQDWKITLRDWYILFDPSIAH